MDDTVEASTSDLEFDVPGNELAEWIVFHAGDFKPFMISISELRDVRDVCLVMIARRRQNKSHTASKHFATLAVHCLQQ